MSLSQQSRANTSSLQAASPAASITIDALVLLYRNREDGRRGENVPKKRGLYSADGSAFLVRAGGPCADNGWYSAIRRIGLVLSEKARHR